MTFELTDHPRFIVWRAARGVPLRWMPRDLEGRWDHWWPVPAPAGLCQIEGPHAHRVPTDLREHRADGAVAQVIELHPCGGNYDDGS